MLPVKILTALAAKFGAHILLFRDPYFHAAVLAEKDPDRRLIRIGYNRCPVESFAAVAVRVAAA